MLPESSSAQTRCLRGLCPLCFPTPAPALLLGAIFRCETGSRHGKWEHGQWQRLSLGSSGSVPESCQGLWGSAAGLQPDHTSVCCGAACPLLPGGRLLGREGGYRATAGGGIPLWKRVELHLLACLGKAPKFPGKVQPRVIGVDACEFPKLGGQRPEVTRRSEAVMNQNGCVLSKLF